LAAAEAQAAVRPDLFGLEEITKIFIGYPFL
jgi:hypothetical protein